MKKKAIFILWASASLTPLCATMKNSYAKIQKPIFEINSFHPESIRLDWSRFGASCFSHETLDRNMWNVADIPTIRRMFFTLDYPEDWDVSPVWDVSPNMWNVADIPTMHPMTKMTDEFSNTINSSDTSPGEKKARDNQETGNKTHIKPWNGVVDKWRSLFLRKTKK
ncbi:MAG: hypothetical protein AAF335_00350 [Bacteroidota bacterium]